MEMLGTSQASSFSLSPRVYICPHAFVSCYTRQQWQPCEIITPSCGDRTFHLLFHAGSVQWTLSNCSFNVRFKVILLLWGCWLFFTQRTCEHE